MKSWLRQGLVIGLAFGLGVLLTVRLSPTYFETLQEHAALFDTNEKQYRLISPMLTCGDYPAQTPGKIEKLKDRIEDFVFDQTNQHTISDFSMYYRDLNNGPWFGVNLERQFTPGSLLKLPLLMSVLQQFETNPNMRLQKITARGAVGGKQLLPPGNPIRPGVEYTYDELLDAMITDSDNDAATLLYLHSDQNIYNDIFEDIGIEPPKVGLDYLIDVRTYASFFRILYNATIITRESSEKALELLLKVKYRDGLAAGVPATVPVAHKFGEREVGTNPTIVQHHDCGIVYAENSPYLICVMTRGFALQDLQQVIAHVSKLVYENQVKKD